jgi:CRISP-associated protein Cas1
VVGRGRPRGAVESIPGLPSAHMEPMRPVVDRAVLHLIDTVTFTGADFSIQHDGVCRMNPELARRMAQLALEWCQVSSS